MEKLRLKIKMKADKLVLPLAYKSIIQGVIYNMMDKKVDLERILQEYQNVYTEHYDSETHISRMMKVLPKR